MSDLKPQIEKELPMLRRFATALCGQTQTGDAFIYSIIEELVANPGLMDKRELRLDLYRSLVRRHATAESDNVIRLHSRTDRAAENSERVLSSLPDEQRQAVLLYALEDFSPAEVAEILGRSPAYVSELLGQAKARIARSLRTRVLLIEDDPLVALLLEDMIGEMGHEVMGVAATRDEAVHTARAGEPGLIITDIVLADRSSGLDAVADICGSGKSIPTVVLTGYPDRLRKGSRKFLVPKPFEYGSLETAVNSALLSSGAH